LVRAWIDVDDFGRQFLTRVGTGVVLSVTPIGDLGSVRPRINAQTADSRGLPSAPLHRIAILIDGVAGSTSAIRFKASAIIATDDPMFAIAMDAIRHEEPCGFAIAWHRHEDLPTESAIESLDLAMEAHCILVELVSLRKDLAATARRGAWAH
jgi:hypothetical protein